MIIALMGAPGSGKARLASAAKTQMEFEIIEDCCYTIPDRFDVPVGMMADYRTEVYLAYQRIFQLHSLRKREGRFILTHSLVDSVAYTTLKADDLIRTSSPMEASLRWTMAAMTISTGADDSFSSDLVAFLPGFEDDGLAFNERLSHQLSEIQEYSIPESIVLPADLDKQIEILTNVVNNATQKSS